MVGYEPLMVYGEPLMVRVNEPLMVAYLTPDISKIFYDEPLMVCCELLMVELFFPKWSGYELSCPLKIR